MTYEIAASINYLSNCIWAFNDFSVKWYMFINKRKQENKKISLLIIVKE